MDVTDFGRVNGYEQQVQPLRNRRVNTYLGIPFAQPPTGDLRFRPPQPLTPPGGDDTEYNATELPASCYQIRDTAFDDRLVNLWNPNTDLSEDCLYLNIWQPQFADRSTVLVRFLYFLVIMSID